MRTISQRENQVLHLISNEYTMEEIAAQLNLSKETIRSYRKNLYQKLDVKNTAGLIRRAFELGLLTIKKAA